MLDVNGNGENGIQQMKKMSKSAPATRRDTVKSPVYTSNKIVKTNTDTYTNNRCYGRKSNENVSEMNMTMCRNKKSKYYSLYTN